jgi:hypothetical protein
VVALAQPGRRDADVVDDQHGERGGGDCSDHHGESPVPKLSKEVDEVHAVLAVDLVGGVKRVTV